MEIFKSHIPHAGVNKNGASFMSFIKGIRTHWNILHGIHHTDPTILSTYLHLVVIDCVQ